MRKANSSSGTWAEVHGTLGDVTKGDPGKSAYEIAVEHGYEGTEEEWLAYVQANADRAVSASTAAQEAKETAQHASDEAQGHAESASTSAGVAHTEAEAAAESAARAEAAATSAGESRDNATASATDAADSATAAAGSATEAASQALLATGRADEARQSQIDAHDSEVHCEEMWLAFQRSPDLAKQYAEAAALSAQNAADSETAAEGYKEDVEDLKLEIVGYRNETSTLCTQTGVYASQADASAQAAAASAAEAGASAEYVSQRIESEANSALESHLAGKLDADGKAVDSAHADNADTVNNHTVLSDVPENAVFTDTTYQQMTDQELEDGVSTQGRVVAAHTIATFILNVIADVINSAPAALDTLEELAAAINDDPDFHVTVMNEIGKKLDKAGGVVTGDLTVNGTLTADLTGNADTATKATGDKNGNDITTTYVKLTGAQTISGVKTFTGKPILTNGLSMRVTDTNSTTTRDGQVLHANSGNNSSGINLAIGGGANMIVGSGESFSAQLNALAGDGEEDLYLLSDRAIYLKPNANTFANAKTITLNAAGELSGLAKVTATAFAGALTGNAATATKAAQLTTACTIDGVSFNGTGNITHYGVCSTDAATVEKTVACTGFTLGTGARIAVKFTVTNTAANPTLNVNSTGGKAVYYRGAAISAGYLAAGRTYTFVYNGTQYDLIGDLNTDTNNATAQNISTANATYPILLGNRANATANIGNKAALFSSKAKLNASTAQMTLNGKVVPVVSSFNSTTGVLALVSSGS